MIIINYMKYTKYTNYYILISINPKIGNSSVEELKNRRRLPLFSSPFSLLLLLLSIL